MRYELAIAIRYLRGKRKQTSVTVVTAIAILGVTLGVAALIIVLAVMNGFQNELRDRILGTNAHIVVFDRADQPIADYAELLAKIRGVHGVKEASPFIISKAMARHGRRSEGLVLKGIDPTRAPRVLTLNQDLIKGSIEPLKAPIAQTSRGPVHGILLGKLLAETLDAKVGDRIELMIPGTQSEGTERKAILGYFEVSGIFESRMHEYDSLWSYVSIKAAQRFLGIGHRVTGLEVSVYDIWQSDRIEREIASTLGHRTWTQDWQSMNSMFFNALELQKWALFIILCLIVLVAAFNVVSTLTLMVMEKRRDIGILKAIGATRSGLRRIFLYQGIIIGTMGTALGAALGTAISIIADAFQLIKIEGEIYYISYLPLQLSASDLALVAGASLIISFVTTLLPSFKAAGLDPVEAIRYE